MRVFAGILAGLAGKGVDFRLIVPPWVAATDTLTLPDALIYFWTFFVRHGLLRLADLPRMPPPGMTDVAWALVRGAVTGEYLCDALDAGKNGHGYAAIGVRISNRRRRILRPCRFC
ncbi:MAG: hypothetical protein Q8L54_04060 [Devosia sp.]|nr:hypothetical protein [Devosia sp.]